MGLCLGVRRDRGLGKRLEALCQGLASGLPHAHTHDEGGAQPPTMSKLLPMGMYWVAATVVGWS